MRLTNRLQVEMTRLIEPQIPGLRRYARLLTREAAGADDLVQDCLERALTRWRSRLPGSDVRAWLFAILHNLAVDRIRTAQRRGLHLPFDELDKSPPMARASQEDALYHRDLLQTVDRLPDEQRSVLLLIAIEELSYAEAAAALGVPVGTIMSRLHRARDRLSRELAGRPTDAPSIRIVQ